MLLSAAALRKTCRGFSFFFLMGVFSLYCLQESSALAFLALPFLKYVIHHLLCCVLFTKWAVLFVFLVEISTWIWWTGRGFSTLDTSMLQSQRLSSQRQQVVTCPRGKSLQHRMLHQRRGQVFPKGTKGCLLDTFQWGLSPKMGWEQTMNLWWLLNLKKKCRQCLEWFCDKFLQPGLFQEVQVSSSD